MDWLAVYQAALRSRAASGHYNDNVRVQTADGPVIVRSPRPGAEVMDLRLWPEACVLTAISGVERVPRLLHACDRPSFQVHEFVPGEILDSVCPRGMAVPVHVIDDVVGLWRTTTGLSPAVAPSLDLPATWPDDGDTVGFAMRLGEFVAQVHERCQRQYGALYAQLGVPDDPTAYVRDRWSGLAERPFGLLHGDLHRKNMMVQAGRTTFLDWELALWGDPLHELAVHLHKMSYLPHEQRRLVAGWLEVGEPRRRNGWERDLPLYLALERIKSAVVDSVRCAIELARGALGTAGERTLIDKLTGKLDAASAYWGPGVSRSARQVGRVLRAWVAQRGAGGTG